MRERVWSSAFRRSGPRKRGTPNVWRRARSDAPYLALLGENDSMKLLQLGRELIARAALRIRKNQQHALAAKFFQGKFAAIDSGQAEVWRDCARFESIAVETASRP